MNFTRQEVNMVHPEAFKISLLHLENLIKCQDDIIETLVEKTQSTEEVANLRRKHQKAKEKELDRGVMLEMNFAEKRVPQLHPETICRCFRHLENLIKRQEKTIEKLKKKIDCTQNVVYQLIGDLYNQTTQATAIHTHLNTLFEYKLQDKDSDEESDEESDKEEEKQVDKSKWNIWPTTRQEDENEEHIKLLKARLKQALAKPILCRSSVAHAEPINLDDLVEEHEEQDSQLLLRKIANSTSNSKKQFSRDLCGNE